MCRLAAYLGPEISLNEFIISQPHSLYKQSWQPKEMQDALLNADGYGFAWYEQENTLRHYRNTVPIWADPNLENLSYTLKQPQWLAYVRSATPGQGLGIENTQPFLHNNIGMIHNGFITNFSSIKPKLIDIIQTDYLQLIKGNTDSEYLFALWLQIYAANSDTIEAFKTFSDLVAKTCEQTSAMVNVIVSEQNVLYALKYAVNMQPPTLYSLESKQQDQTQFFIASEPFNDQNWLSIPDHSILQINKQDGCRIHKLI